MSVSDRELLHHLSRMPFLDTAELAMITGEAHVAIHRGLASLLSSGTVGRVSHGTAHMPPSGRHYLTAKGITEAAGMLGFDTASDYVRAHPVSREWLTLLNRRMDAVATIYLLVASPSPGADGLRTQVDFPRPVPRHHHAARRAQLRVGAPGFSAQAPFPLRPAAGHRRVRVPAPPPRLTKSRTFTLTLTLNL